MTSGSRFLSSFIAMLALVGLLAGANRPVQAAGEPAKILLFGDSLIAGYGLPHDEGFAPQLQAALAAAGHDVTVINSGVSGDTSAAGLARLEWALADAPDLVVVELGANDALRGVEPAQTRANLDRIIGTLKERNVTVLLAGMMAPPNMGREYGAEFNAIYPELAQQHDVPLYPFFLDGVAADRALNQDDGMHPNAGGVAVIIEKMLPTLIGVLETTS
ncbi:arylesterase [Thalassospira sp.]|uniref:arylesterase n=1 Tax=Thalassospira sp. TaxID=1912094 RepID=UPI0027368128|nr:arylesterase [Thalassospira sp.]MDP2699011.1 arylesterase [Thalassospira sp.]